MFNRHSERHWLLPLQPYRNDTLNKSSKRTEKCQTMSKTTSFARVVAMLANRIFVTILRKFLVASFAYICCHHDHYFFLSDPHEAKVATRYSKPNGDFQDEKPSQRRWFDDARLMRYRWSWRVHSMPMLPVLAVSVRILFPRKTKTKRNCINERMKSWKFQPHEPLATYSIHFFPSWLDSTIFLKHRPRVRPDLGLEKYRRCMLDIDDLTGRCLLEAPVACHRDIFYEKDRSTPAECNLRR